MTTYRFLVGSALVLVVILSYRLWLADDGYQEVWRLQKQTAEQQVEVLAKQQRNLQLEAEVKDLKEGVDAVEERARSELGMTRRGETFVQILEEEKTPEE